MLRELNIRELDMEQLILEKAERASVAFEKSRGSRE